MREAAGAVFEGRAAWGVDVGDARTMLEFWPGESVRCCVTSPPYYGLRDYGTGWWEGGDEACDHKPKAAPLAARPSNGLTGGKSTVDAGTIQRNRCHCGAVRVDRQLGLEPTPEDYVARMVELFREVRRVLTPDGTLWLNIGDSYAMSGMGGNPAESEHRKQATNEGSLIPGRKAPPVCKPKDLIGVPWMLAFALRADGWFLRSDTIWHKPNPMPESVTDRPTKSHEYLFLLSKSERYYYDAEAVAEAAAEATYHRLAQDVEGQAGSDRANGGAKTNGPMKAVGGKCFGKQKHDATGTGQQSRTYDRPAYLTRNRRSVWTIPTQSYHGAHFAVMPPKLVEPCVLAGSARGDIVLDPFAGSGTTLAVALDHGRRAVGCELNPKYVELIEQRMGGVTLSLC